MKACSACKTSDVICDTEIRMHDYRWQKYLGLSNNLAAMGGYEWLGYLMTRYS